MTSTEQLTIEFGGSNDISLDTLSECLKATLDCMSLIADENLSKDTYCKFLIEDVKKGSFDLIIKIIVDSLVLVAPIGTLFFEIWKFRKDLRGRQPKEVIKEDGNYYAVMEDGRRVYVKPDVFNTYTSNNDIEKACAKMCEALNSDDKRTNLKIVDSKDNEKKVVELDEETIALTKTPIDAEALSDNYIESVSTVDLKVRKCCFVGNARWDFMLLLNNTTISAEVLDAEFLSKVQNSDILISPKAIIRATLRSRTHKSEKTKPKYAVLEVIKVLDVEKGNEQMLMKI